MGRTDDAAAGRKQRARRRLRLSVRMACFFANIFGKTLVEVASRIVATKDQNESLAIQHLKGAVTECRAAHTFRVEMSGLLNNQSAGSNRGK